jgi:hypothetical protein
VSTVQQSVLNIFILLGDLHRRVDEAVRHVGHLLDDSQSDALFRGLFGDLLEEVSDDGMAVGGDSNRPSGGYESGDDSSRGEGLARTRRTLDRQK